MAPSPQLTSSSYLSFVHDFSLWSLLKEKKTKSLVEVLERYWESFFFRLLDKNEVVEQKSDWIIFYLADLFSVFFWCLSFC